MGKGRGSEDFLRARTQKGWMVGLSIMATQASAITFLSAPGLAFREGLGFVQFYLGLPLAMVVLSVVALPIYYRLNVYTAYQFLESRFDGRVRSLAALLFLTQRGLAAGLTIYAPALILSTVLNWDLVWTNLLTGTLVMAYTLSGGSRAVARTQLLQMLVILAGMGLAVWWMMGSMPEGWKGSEVLALSALAGKTEALVLRMNWEDRYSLWSGLIGGGFLMLSYFGTDQSQVQRYLGGQSLEESRKGLMLNAFLKLPMQLMILGIGLVLYVFYVMEVPPVNFKVGAAGDGGAGDASALGSEGAVLARAFEAEAKERRRVALAWQASEQGPQKEALAGAFLHSEQRMEQLRTQFQARQKEAFPDSDWKDTNYIFIRYVLDHLPVGLVGLLVSMVFCASMSSTSAELSALSTTTLVDFYARRNPAAAQGAKALRLGRWFTLGWGLYALGFALLAQHLGTLIEAVNMLGSLVYGTILGLFLAAFLPNRIGSGAVLGAAILTEGMVLLLFFVLKIPYLWLNAVGALLVPLLAVIFGRMLPRPSH